MGLINGFETGDDFIPFDFPAGSTASLIDDTDYTGGTGAIFDINDMDFGTPSTNGDTGAVFDINDIDFGTPAFGGIDNEAGDLGGGAAFDQDEFYRSIGIDPASMKDEPPMSQADIDAIINGTYLGGAGAGGSGGKAGGSGTTPRTTTTTPRTTTTTPRTTTTQRTTTTPGTTTPGTTRTTTPNTTAVIQNILRSLPQSQTQNMDLLGLLALLAGGGSQAAPTVISPDVAEIRLMEDIFGTELSAPTTATRKYYGGGDVDSLLKVIRS
jgi:hypothetical protein